MNKEQASNLYEAVFRNFYNPETGMLLENAPYQQGDRESCYLFSYFATTGMVYQALKAGIGKRSFYQQLMEGFAYYRCAPMEGGLVKYHSECGTAPETGHGPCFFDDNIWVARNFLFAYELLGDSNYLEEAQRIVRYTYTAWNWELGGLVWNENGLGENATEQELERGLSANACSILVNAQLYLLTGEESYLQWANRFYDFCKTIQDPQSKMYYNGVHTLLVQGARKAGTVNKDLYAYNPGSMILADLVLAQITGNREYFDDAVGACQAAHKAFLRKNEDGKPSSYQDFVWFLTILAQACQALLQAGSTAPTPVLEVFESSLTYALSHYQAQSGLVAHDYVSGWRNPGQNEVYDRLLLTHSGTAEIAVILYSCYQKAADQMGSSSRHP